MGSEPIPQAQEGDNDSPSEGEFLDNEFDSFDACLDFGYQAREFFVLPDTPALDKAHQQDTSRVASAGGDTVSNQPAWTQLPLDHLTADQPEDDPDLTTMDPRKMREQQLQDPTCNDLIRALRTYQNLCNSWYFPNMLRQSREYVARCPVCQCRKGSAVRVPMQGHPPPEAPLVMVSADLMDLRSSSRGYRYVLSIIDHHTRFLQLARLRDKTAERSNGVVERSNRAVKDALAALVQRAPSQWPIHLPAVCLALYMAIHRSVGDQPLYLLSGRMALFAKGLTNDQTPDEGLMVKRLSDACHLAVEVSLKTRETNKAYYDQRAKATPTFEQGSLVVRKVEGTRRPLGDSWLGPGRIVRQLGPVTFDVLDLQEPYCAVRVHANQLKSYLPPSELDFAEEADQLPRPVPVAASSSVVTLIDELTSESAVS
ncbi:hypothetical protein C7M84_019350 [Penaeus vannamei]|uniref:RNA-directed DNA polymerase n=1 Tax=Penaeus vannamei TaxID=6689 RepID=A0A423SEW4_PENVA|nr:hypothetical protein C7M84_019350 [Penaeus vannamei]